MNDRKENDSGHILNKIELSDEQFESLLPKPRKEITCKDCGEKWKFFHKCEKRTPVRYHINLPNHQS